MPGSAKLGIFLVFYTGMSVFGLYRIKAAPSFCSWSFFIGFFLYAAGFLIWLFLLKRFPLSLIFPLCSACILIGTQLSGWFLLHEAVSIKGIIAVVLAISAAILCSLDMNI